MITESDFYSDNPQYKAPGEILKAIIAGELEVNSAAVAMTTQYIQEFIQNNSLPELPWVAKELSNMLKANSEILITDIAQEFTEVFYAAQSSVEQSFNGDVTVSDNN